MDFGLERIHSRDNARIELVKGITTCGRDKKNKIICLSVYVSRKHCIFICSGSDLHVTDLGSSNGLFINGTEQGSRESIRLYDNDIVGIGSAEIDPFDDNVYAYKIFIKQTSVPDQNVNVPVKIENALSTTVLSNDELHLLQNVFRNAAAPTKRVLGEKCRSLIDCDISVPHKISKHQNNNGHSSRTSLSKETVSSFTSDNRNSHSSHNGHSSKTSLSKETASSFSPNNRNSHSSHNGHSSKTSLSKETASNFSRDNKNSCSNHNDHSSKTSLSKKTASNFSPDNRNSHSSHNGHSSKTSLSKKTTSNFSPDKNSRRNHDTNNLTKISTDTRTEDDEEDDEDDIEIIHTSLARDRKKHDIKNSDLQFSTRLNNNKSNIDRKTLQRSTKSRKTCKDNELRDISDENDKSDSKDNSRGVNEVYTTKKISNSIDKMDDLFSKPSTSNHVHSDHTMIKMEDELQTTDKDESSAVDQTTCSTSRKSKKVKHEQKTRFSEIDIVDLSDDEDGIFPTSQLFDNIFEDNTDSKVGIKQECDNNDENFGKTGLSDVDDEVVVLTDYEDEDNPWLERLSRSQLMNSENEEKQPVFNEVKDEIDLGIWEEDEIWNIIQSEAPHTLQVIAPKDTSLEPHTDEDDKSKDEDNSNNNNNNTKLLTEKVDAMDTDDVGPSNELSTSKNDTTSDTSKGKTDIEQDTDKLNKLNKKSISLEDLKLKLAKKTASKLLIPVIEPLHLPVKRRRNDHSKDTASKVNEKSPKLTKKEKKMSKLKKKLDDSFYNQQKQRKETPKSPTGGHSPNEIKAGPSISKAEKQMIIEKRKMKLKEIAEEEKKLSVKNDENVTRRIAKPRAKMSLKNRGDFLCAEQEPRASKSLPEKSTKSKSLPKKSTESSKPLLEKSIESSTSLPKKSTESSKLFLEKSTKSSKSLPEKSTESSKSNNQSKNQLTKADMFKELTTSSTERNEKKNVSKDTVNNKIAASFQQSLHLDNNANTVEIPKDNLKAIDRREKSSKETKQSNQNANTSESRDRSTERTSILVQRKNLLVRSDLHKPKKKKRVTFSEDRKVKEYQIDSPNTLKKLVGKDAPIPMNKLEAKKSTICAEWVPKLEEFLLRIFMWNPVWLEEQRHLKKDPPIVADRELQSMKLNYDSYKQYYDVALPLLLHEIWCTMTKDFEVIESNKQRPTMMSSIVDNSITRIPIPKTDLFLTTLMIEVLVGREELDRKMHPVYGDLVFLEYVRNKNSNIRIFAYIIDSHQMIITNFTYYNKELLKYVRNPYAVITYTLLTRPLEHNISVNRVQRVRTVMYLRANIRMVQALQYLPKSPLLNLILNPRVEDYQLPPIKEQHPQLITNDELNPKQQEAVFRVSEAVLKKEAKLCFIQGPPGTGKSKVIINLVAQILYGENKNNKKSLRILVCAPSNAAVDEIVLRLLNIRSTLPSKNRFNMVRIGRPETMHPMAKTISVTDLAKRHLATMASRCKQEIEDITQIEAQLNFLEIKRATSQNMNEAQTKDLQKKLFELMLKFELLKCGKTRVEEFSSKERAKFQRMAENVILTGADIITCTLSSCYTNLMESTFGGNKERITVCIVDEATQSCEAETLIPLMLGVKTLVLVGDPNQLPATILSQRAKRLGLDRSVFSRVQHAFTSQLNSPIIMLNTQYRMEYAISYWPNRYFYGGKLKNAAECNMTFPFFAYRVLCHNSVQNDDKFSNSTEATFVANIIYSMLMFGKWQDDTSTSVGVLTPYNNQRTLVLNKINEKICTLPDRIKKRIIFEVNTVDGFQGQERDVIIMSCVRSHGIGFLSDKQRLCVALTRAKHSLILCGNFNTFKKDQMWHALLADARSRGVLCNVDANATPTIIRQFIVKTQ